MVAGLSDFEHHGRIQVFVGVDVGKGAHHAAALERTGERSLNSTLPNDETKLRALIGKLKVHGLILLVVDQPATMGALAVARAEDIRGGASSQAGDAALPICMPVKRRPMQLAFAVSRVGIGADDLIRFEKKNRDRQW